MRHYRRLLAFAAGLLAALALAAPAAAAPVATALTTTETEQLCHITYTTTEWSTGYVVSVSVTNISNRPVTVSGTINLQPPGYVVQGWGVTFTISGTTVWLRPWNPVLQPGQTINLGYTGTGRLVLPIIVCQ